MITMSKNIIIHKIIKNYHICSVIVSQVKHMQISAVGYTDGVHSHWEYQGSYSINS